MDLNFEQLLAEHGQRAEFDPYKLAREFKAEKYPSKERGDIKITFHFGQLFQPGQGNIVRFFRTETPPSGKGAFKNYILPDRLFRGEIAKFLHQKDFEITMERVELVLLCLQTV